MCIILQTPVWCSPPASDNEDSKPNIRQHQAPPANDDSDIEVITPDDFYPPSTHLVVDATGAVNLLHQGAMMRGCLRAAIKLVQGELMFVNAFPDGPTRIKFNRDCIYRAASDIPAIDIATRATKDTWFLSQLSNLVSILNIVLIHFDIIVLA